MITRILPSEEWHRLGHTDLASVVAQFPAECMTPIVVEQDGEIIGCWAVLTLCHAEGVWIAPAYRKRVSVARRLITAMRGLVQARGLGGVLTGAADDGVAAMLGRLGAVKVPYGNYFWPMPAAK